MLDQVERVLKPFFVENPCSDQWVGTAADLRNLMVSNDSPLSLSEVKKVPPPNWLGKHLKKLEEAMPWKFHQRKTKENMQWEVEK